MRPAGDRNQKVVEDMIENTDAEQIERLNARVVELMRQRDALAEALEEALLQLEYMQERHGYATGATIIARTRAALASYRSTKP